VEHIGENWRRRPRQPIIFTKVAQDGVSEQARLSTLVRPISD
jgi:hypothetical protein